MLVIQLKKTDYDTKVNKIEKKLTDHNHDEYITFPEFNKITAESFSARVAQANLVTKIDFDDKLKNLNKKTNSNKTKHLIVENEFKKLQTFDSIHFLCESHFEDDGIQNYLVFQKIFRYFKIVSNNDNNFYHGNLKDCLVKAFGFVRKWFFFSQ